MPEQQLITTRTVCKGDNGIPRITIQQKILAFFGFDIGAKFKVLKTQEGILLELIKEEKKSVKKDKEKPSKEVKKTSKVSKQSAKR